MAVIQMSFYGRDGKPIGFYSKSDFDQSVDSTSEVESTGGTTTEDKTPTPVAADAQEIITMDQNVNQSDIGLGTAYSSAVA